MTLAEWLVALGSAAAIGLVYWWFFAAESRAGAAAVRASGIQEATIVVQGGYDPARLKLRANRPIRLVFDRRETGGCSEEVVFPTLGLRRFLPPFQKTTLDLEPQPAGRYEFTCGMSMLHGRLEVE